MKIAKPITAIVLWIVLAAGPAAGRAAPSDEGEKATAQFMGSRVVKMTLHPMPEPTPAMKYLLLPPATALKTGNAAVNYLQAVFLISQYGMADKQKQIEQWLEQPMEKMDLDHVLLNFRYYYDDRVALAARRTYCDWQYPLVKGEGLVLPSLPEFRDLGQVVALRAKLQIAQRRFEQAGHTLRTGFALARDLEKGAALIQAVVGVSIAHLMLRRVEQWVQQPEAPNLYWALTALPDPLIGLRRSLAVEAHLLALKFQDVVDLDALRTRPISEAAARRLKRKLWEWAQWRDLSTPRKRGDTYITLTGFYPRAKAQLVQWGDKPELIHAMPVAQVLVLHALVQYRRLFDERRKWFAVPYYMARAELRELDLPLEKRLDEHGQLSPLIKPFLSPLRLSYLIMAMLHRHIAMLRIVEAIRLYAAAHSGELPPSLEAIQAVPIPEDPVRGEPFKYTLKDGKAILEAPPVPPADTNPPRAGYNEGLRYVLTIDEE